MKNKNNLLIIGASGHGKVVADIALKMNKWDNISFLDDDKNAKSWLNIEVIGSLLYAYTHIEEYDIFVGIGDNIIRERIQKKLEAEGASIPTLIHPNSVIGEEVVLESGTVVVAGAVINCCTKIGKGCIINTGSTIGHDNFIEDFVHISPGANIAGTVVVGQRSWLGIGSVVINNVEITNDCKVGAGTIVVKNLTEPGTYLGVPARRKD